MSNSISRPYRANLFHFVGQGARQAPAAEEKHRPQTFREEAFNVLTHGAGAALAVIGTAALTVRAARGGSATAVVSALLYGFSLIFLYTASTLYHAAGVPEVKRRRRIWDHCSIFLLILGSYIPLCLVTIGGALGWTLFLTNAVLAAAGVISRVVNMSRGKSRLSVALYLVMGWLVLPAIGPVVRALPPVGLGLLVAGGVAYTAGVYFYKKDGPYMHVIWHLFVLAGSILQYGCIFLCCT